MDISSDIEEEREPLLPPISESSRRTHRQTSSSSAEAETSGSPRSAHRNPHVGLNIGIGTMAPPLLCSVRELCDNNHFSFPRESESDDRDVESRSSFSDEDDIMTLRAKLALTLVTISYFLGYIPSMVIMNPYIYDRIAEEFDYQIKTSSEMPCVADIQNITANTSSIEIQNEIERRVSMLELYLQLTTYLTALIPILLLGPITDKFGRRAGFLLPISGTLMKQVMYIVVVTCKLPIPFLYLAHGMEALGGSFAAMLSAIFSVTSDITQSGVGRSRCIALLEALQTLSSTAAQIYTAQWMRYGYVSPLICALANCCLAFMMATLFPETLLAAVSNGDTKLLRGDHGSETGQVEQNSCLRRVLKLSSKCWKMIRKSVMLYVKHDFRREIACGQPNILCKRRLVLIIFICTVAVNFSRIGVEALFQIKYPLCWAATKVYTFTGIRIFLSWVAILVMLILMQKVFKMADRHVAIVGIVSSLLSNAAISLAVNDAMVYEAAIVGFMTRSIIPMLRSTMSSLVDYASQGAMYSSLSCVESLGAGIFSTAAYRIYYTTLSSWAGEIFMIFACIMVIALTLLVILNVIFARESTTNNVNTDVTWNIQENNDSDIES